jgi:hypothetical protein
VSLGLKVSVAAVTLLSAPIMRPNVTRLTLTFWSDALGVGVTLGRAGATGLSFLQPGALSAAARRKRHT